MITRDFYNVSIRVHPAVAKWMDTVFEKKNNAYDIRKMACYTLIQFCLLKKNIKIPVKKSKKFEKFIPVRILINEWDFDHFGWEIPSAAQAQISKFFYGNMMEYFCYHVAYSYVYGNIPRDETIRRILVEYLFEDSELNYFTLRKYYQRKFADTERNLLEFKKFTIYTMDAK